MALATGSRIGPYEIAALIGAGGMGEVYRARDTRLKRDVALKTLPESFASDPDRLARFQREAEVLASLNHPHIAAIHGLEESGTTHALVMELVEGDTLADRIARGAIPVDEALPIARQIAEALEAAHEHGIIHRDLKPANIKVRPDGTVKVLDFGLAKALEPTSARSIDATASPTITSPALMTGVGVLLGTAAYMSPEQARGKAVDKRSDIWAFGCVLYEMFTGTRAFDGEDVSVVMAGVIKSDPDWNTLPTNTPQAVRQVIHRCLQKDPRQRLRDLGDVRLALEGAFASAAAEAAPSPSSAPRATRVRRATPWVVGIVAGSVVTGFAAWLLLRPADPPSAPMATRFTVTLPEGEQLPLQNGTLVAISPDGRSLLYRARRNGVFRLYRRSLDRFDATPVGDENAGESAFFSPDGAWIAFWVGTTLKRVPLSGGPSQMLAALPSNGIRGASWATDGTIVLGGRDAGLLRLSENGGTPEPIATPEPGRQLWYPQVLPGGRAVLFTSSAQAQDAGELELLLLDTGERRKLLPGSAGRYLPSGHLVFVRGGALWATGFDLRRLAVIGSPALVMEGLRIEGGGAVQFDVATSGSLIYIPGANAPRRLTWIDRQGRSEPIAAPPRPYFNVRVSPDGTRLALELREGENDIWTWDLSRGTLTRLTFGPAPEQYPAWMPDGRRLVFTSASEGTPAPFWQAADGTGIAERLATDRRTLDQASVAPDGKRIVFRAASAGAGEDIVMLALDGERRVQPLIATPFTERNAELSPDGRWLAYQSNESGRFEVYVRPFPQVNGGRWQISTGGGTFPVWGPDGRELFYLVDGTVMTVSIQAGTSFSAGTAIRLIDLTDIAIGQQFRTYDISRDGRRFVYAKDEGQSSRAQINVVVNWLEELKRLVPTD